MLSTSFDEVRVRRTRDIWGWSVEGAVLQWLTQPTTVLAAKITRNFLFREPVNLGPYCPYIMP
jgi:hypothetical protein